MKLTSPIKHIDSIQVRDSSDREISKVFKNPVVVDQATGASYAEVDLEREVAGLSIYATKAAVMRIGGEDGLEIEIPEGVVLFLPWIFTEFEVKQKAEAGVFYAFGGY